MLATLYSRFLAWCGRQPLAKLQHLQVVLYTRGGCHLCEDALASLRKAQQHYRFALAVVDIDSDRDLEHRFGEHIPVVSINDKIRFRGAVNPMLLTRLLDAEAAMVTRGGHSTDRHALCHSVDARSGDRLSAKARKRRLV